MAMQTRKRIEALLSTLSEGALEREEAIALSLLSAASGESIFLLGLPGVAKSMIARRLSLAFRDARRFEYLMSRFSTPDEIFGPVSISRLKDEDSYERVVDGYLPTADVVFLDEIWKAGPAIQNSLLTALNEKIFRNGRNDIALPLKGIIAASNELPAEGEGLEALWDRFLIRYVVNPIREKGNFFTLLSAKTVIGCSVPEELKFSSQEISYLLQERDRIGIPDPVMELLYSLRVRYSEAENLLKENHPPKGGEEDGDDEDNVPYVSDRRWKKIAGILRSSALLNGRGEVDWSDCLLLEHLLWNKDSQRLRVCEDIAKELTAAILGNSAAFPDAGKWIRPSKEEGEVKFWSPDGGKHYGFEASGELILISAEDYRKLDSVPKWGRFLEGGELSIGGDSGEIRVRSPKSGVITVGSFNYPLKTERGNASKSADFISSVLGRTGRKIDSFTDMVSDNLFTRSLPEYPFLFAEMRKFRSGIYSAKNTR